MRMARTKAFEIDAVLDKAMRLFWTQGYEKTSMQDLVDNMGINRKSIYDTFGDKHTLFLKALARYDQFANDRSIPESQRFRDDASWQTTSNFSFGGVSKSDFTQRLFDGQFCNGACCD